MSQSLLQTLLFTTIPVLAMVGGSAIATFRVPGAKLTSAFQHFAAGVVFAAVAVELMPRLDAIGFPVAMILGFIAGIALMLASKSAFERSGMFVPMAIDLFIDGLLVAIGFAAGKLGGVVLLIGLTVETLSLGLSTAPSLASQGFARAEAVGILSLVATAIFAGAAAGHLVAGSSGLLLAGILGFGVAALLYLVTEELLAEAHASPDTTVVTATFFLGFLMPVILAVL